MNKDNLKNQEKITELLLKLYFENYPVFEAISIFEKIIQTINKKEVIK